MTARPILAALAASAFCAPAQAATLVIQATAKDGRGTIYAGVCAGDFEEKNCRNRGSAPAKPGIVEIRIEGVKAGRYAIAAYQDVNGNGRLDKFAFFPTEPFGFSNDTGRMGPPRYDQALIDVSEPTTVVKVTVK